jgi:hypothetical protein
MLQSFDRGYSRSITSPAISASAWTSAPAPGERRAGRRRPIGFVGASEQAVVDYIQRHFRRSSAPGPHHDRRRPAAVFARKHRRELFPETPSSGFGGPAIPRGAPLGDNETRVPVVNDFPR